MRIPGLGLLLDKLAERLSSRRFGEQRDERLLQILLLSRYQELRHTGRLPTFADVEFGAYSQNGEDGILLFLFSIIGTTNKQVVEIGAGNGIECNAANLIINHGWRGLLFDGNEEDVKRGTDFYRRRTNAWRLRRLAPTIAHAWIDREGVNQLIQSHGVSGPIDLLSIDIDGVDWWIWDAIQCVEPRVVILEYNNRWSADQAVTVPYVRDFVGSGASVEGEGYFGASLSAFQILGAKKGYRLIGANSPNTNAFFMHNAVGLECFPEVTVQSCLSSEYALHQHRTKHPLIASLPVVEIGPSGTAPLA